MRKVLMTKDHNGYAAGQIVELEDGPADVFVEWMGCAKYVDEPKAAPAPAAPLAERKSDKQMKSHGGKSLVRTK